MSPKVNSIRQLVGQRVRGLRQDAGLSLRDLSQRAGVSAAMISQLERGSKSPTITVLSAIAAALRVPMARLIEDEVPAAAISVMRGPQHRGIEIGKGVFVTYLGPQSESSSVTFVRAQAEPKGETDVISSHAAGTIERIYIDRGSVELTVGDESVSIRAGDSCTYVGDRPHRLRNIGTGKAVWYNVIERE